jgi:hypothetical protein
VIAAVVRKGMEYMKELTEFDTRLSLLQTLLETSEGKVGWLHVI